MFVDKFFLHIVSFLNYTFYTALQFFLASLSEIWIYFLILSVFFPFFWSKIKICLHYYYPTFIFWDFSDIIFVKTYSSKMHEIQANIRSRRKHFTSLFFHIAHTSLHCIKNKARFHYWLCSIQGTYHTLLVQLHCIAFPAIPHRLTHCDYASRWCLSRARDFISLLFSFLLFFSFLFFPLLRKRRFVHLKFRNSIRRLKVRLSCLFLAL